MSAWPPSDPGSLTLETDEELVLLIQEKDNPLALVVLMNRRLPGLRQWLTWRARWRALGSQDVRDAQDEAVYIIFEATVCFVPAREGAQPHVFARFLQRVAEKRLANFVRDCRRRNRLRDISVDVEVALDARVEKDEGARHARDRIGQGSTDPAEQFAWAGFWNDLEACVQGHGQDAVLLWAGAVAGATLSQDADALDVSRRTVLRRRRELYCNLKQSFDRDL